MPDYEAINDLDDISDFHLLPYECRSFAAIYSILSPEDQALVRDKIDELLKKQWQNGEDENRKPEVSPDQDKTINNDKKPVQKRTKFFEKL